MEKKKMLDVFRLRAEQEDPVMVGELIRSGITFRGTNLWVLMFAIIVASVGLNVNSTAVIIGAMLISPLMGPIMGLGFGLATYDFHMVRKSAVNYSFAILAGLVASALYFSISPLNDAHSELLARTKPNIYDVLIAFFGGLAGIVALASKFKGNVIPGVAIATALMPPLCTAGYGLATGQLDFFFGALYLLTINTVFIALATLITTRMLKYPLKDRPNEKAVARANRWITIVVLLTIIPSIYLGYKFLQQDKFNKTAQKFISLETLFENNYLLNSKIDLEKREITLIYGGKGLSEDHKQLLTKKIEGYGLKNTRLNILQGFSTGDISAENAQIIQFQKEIQELRVENQRLKAMHDSIGKGRQLGWQLLGEITSIYPEITSISLSSAVICEADKNSGAETYVVLINSKKLATTRKEKRKIEAWLKNRLKSKDIRLFIE